MCFCCAVPMAVFGLVLAGVATVFCQSERSQAAKEIVEIAYSAPYNISCEATGEIAQGGAINCFEKGGYRIARDGKKAIVVKLLPSTKPEVILKWGPGPDLVLGQTSDVKAAVAALRPK